MIGADQTSFGRFEMTTVQLEGKDPHDLDAQLWQWRSAHPNAVITKVYPDEPLPLEMQSRSFGEKLLLTNTVMRRFEYEI